MAENTSKQPTVYGLGASDGRWIGLAMGLCVMCMVVSADLNVTAAGGSFIRGLAPLLQWLGLALFVGVPYAVWRMLRRGWVTGRVPATFSAVWLHGICIFLFGSLIMALIMYATLKYLSPNWIEIQTEALAAQMASEPQMSAQAGMLMEAAQSGRLPSAIYMSVTTIWLVAFTGSMWSMIFAFVLTRTHRFRKLRIDFIANRHNDE